jgi:hypothetical protein
MENAFISLIATKSEISQNENHENEKKATPVAKTKSMT